MAAVDVISDLFAAVTEGNLFGTENILTNDFPKQTFKNLSATLLHQASNNGHSEILKFLVEAGAFVDSKNAQQMTALHVSAQKGNVDSVRILLQNKADINSTDYDNRTPLYFAVYDGHIDCVKELLSDPHINISIARKGGWTTVHEAARFGHKACLKILHRAGASIVAETDDATWTPGHMAASNGNLDCLKYLVQNRIDVNVGAGPNHTSTLLHEAAFAGHKECIEFLLKAGADPTIYDRHNLPHHLACQYGHCESLKVFLKHFGEKNKKHLIDAFTNVDPIANALTYHNGLHMASLYGHEECIKALLQHGAKHKPNGMGHYPAMLASSKLHIECLKVLLKDVQMAVNSLEMVGSMNALHLLCMKTYKTSDKAIACACVLLNSGIIDINQFDDLWDVPCCLYLAARNGAIRLVEYLLNSGAAPHNCPSFTGRMLGTRDVAHCARLLENACIKPRSLLLSSRLKVRELLKGVGVHLIYDVPIPKFLQDFVFHGHYKMNLLCAPQT